MAYVAICSENGCPKFTYATAVRALPLRRSFRIHWTPFYERAPNLSSVPLSAAPEAVVGSRANWSKFNPRQVGSVLPKGSRETTCLIWAATAVLCI